MSLREATIEQVLQANHPALIQRCGDDHECAVAPEAGALARQHLGQRLGAVGAQHRQRLQNLEQLARLALGRDDLTVLAPRYQAKAAVLLKQVPGQTGIQGVYLEQLRSFGDLGREDILLGRT